MFIVAKRGIRLRKSFWVWSLILWAIVLGPGAVFLTMHITTILSRSAGGGVAKEPSDMTLDELALDLRKKPDSLDYLTAKAEFALRQMRTQLKATEAQIEAANAARRNAKYMLASVIVVAVSAIVSAVSAYFTYLSALKVR